MADLNVSMILRLVDRATTPIKGVIRQVGALGKAARDADLGRLSQRVGSLRDAQRGAALEAIGLGYAMAQALRPAIQFESAMADVKKVVDFQGANGMAVLGADLQRLSTEIPIAASELAAITAAAGQANVVDAMLPDDEKRAALAEFTRDAARMATAFDIGAGEAGDKMAGLRNIFALNQREVVSLGDAVNHLSNNMASAAAPILNVLERAGSTAKVFGLTGQQTSALASTFLALKTPPEVAGTAINAMLLKLATAPQQGKKFTSAMNKIGFSARDMKDAIADDAQGALLEFLDLIAQEDDKLAILSDLFGAEYSDDIIKLVGGLDQYKKALGLVGTESGYAGSMMQEFQTRSATTENALKLATNRFNVLAITVGSVVLPALNDLLNDLAPIVENVTAFAQANPELVSTLAKVAAALVALKLGSAITLWLFGSLAGGALNVIRALRWLAPILAGPILGAMATFSGALIGLGRAAMLLFANPIGLAVLAVAAAVYLIYENWTPIKDWFKRLWGDVQTIFEGVGDILMGILTLDFGRVIDGLKGLFDGLLSYFTTLFAGIGGAITGTANTVLNAIGMGDAGLPNLANLPAPTLSNTGGNTGPHPRARGGPVGPGQTYLVGEEGPELLQFGASGFITPNDVLIDRRAPMASGRASGGALSITAPITIHAAPGMDAAAIAREVRRQLRDMINGAGDMHDGAFHRGVA